jgi:O-antigen/teichoic acid export membrane protein
MRLSALLSSTARRFGWGIADQAVSSLTNFALGFVVARTVGTAELGFFALAFSTYLLALGLSRVFSADPLVIRYSTVSEDEWRDATRAATGTAAVIGLATGLVIATAGWFFGGTGGRTFVAVGVTLPALVVQDAWRFAFFARGNGRQAFVNDLVWAIALFGLIVMATATGRGTVAWLVGSWGTAAGAAALVGMLQARAVPSPSDAATWYRLNKDLSLPFLGESVATNGSSSLAIYLIGAIANVTALGALHAAGVILGPTKLITSGLALVTVPEAARSLTASPKLLLRQAAAVASVAGVCVLGWGAFAILIPPGIGESILGTNWDEGHALLGPLTIAAAAAAVIIGPRSALAALEEARRILVLRIIGAAVVLGIAVVGAAWAGARGVANAAAAGEMLLASLWWWQFSRSVRRRVATTATNDAGTASNRTPQKINPTDLGPF